MEEVKNDNSEEKMQENCSVADQNSFSFWRPSTWSINQKFMKRSNTSIAVSENTNSQQNGFTKELLDSKVEEIEQEMLKSVKSTYERFYVNIRHDYPVASTSHRIWTIATNKHLNNVPLVLIHGFMSGLAPWRVNIDALSDGSRPVFAFDMVGFGRSSRAPFSTDPIIAENQLVEAIEEWRKEMKLERFILLGHSFGGYLSTAYTLKYSKHVVALILEDPWGFPELSKDQIGNQMNLLKDLASFSYSILKCKMFPNQKLSELCDEELNYHYLTNVNSYSPKTGEEAFRRIANLGFSRMPMLNRFGKIDERLPIYFLFGSNSWIRPEDGYKAMALRPSTAKTSVKIIDGAGHRIHLDKSNEFNEYVKSVLNEIQESLHNLS